MPTLTCSTRDQLIERLQARRTLIISVLRLILHDRQLAQDVFQELMLVIYHQWQDFDTARDLEPWVIGIAKNLAFGARRKQGRYLAFLEDPLLETMIEEVEIAGIESELVRRKRALAPCLRRLRLDYRRLIRFRFWRPLAYEQIAAQTGRTVGSLHIRLHRVKGLLHDCVQKRLSKEEF
jgi:RNA polymerase sigma-70 factor (ECF subfamily)